MNPRRFAPLLVCALLALPAASQTFVNWESPHVHPLDQTPDGRLLLAVNTADARLEIFANTLSGPVPVGSIAVGLDPVTVRARTNGEAWVVNHISDTVTVVDLLQQKIIRTLHTADEPCDVVFAGSPERAFVSCSQANVVQVFPVLSGIRPIQTIPIDGEDPRALAVSPDGSRVYAAIFESGNATTILGGGFLDPNSSPPNVVNDPLGPYGGQNPPPNSGTAFDPPQNPANPAPPRVGMIVRKDAQGRWMDDNNGDWTDLVSGTNAHRSGRVAGWDMPDRDVAVIDAGAASPSVIGHAHGLMNLCMTMAVQPQTGQLVVIGTEAFNEIRFEPNLKSRFLEVRAATVDPQTLQATDLRDLNPHLASIAGTTVSNTLKRRSIGDPRGAAWTTDGRELWVTGMGSNNVVVFTQAGARSGAPIPVGEGPTGIVADGRRDQVHVLDRFAGSVTTLTRSTRARLSQVSFHDATSPAIKIGRKHFYDTHRNSGLGQVSCASCHVDGRMDRLSWDLGDPAGAMLVPDDQNLVGADQLPRGFADWHPMKGPMLTQTMQDIIGKEPHHWRGDRDGIEEFAGAFVSLLGDDAEPNATALQQFEDYLATIVFPPNPFRNIDNSLPSSIDLSDQPSPGLFASSGGLQEGEPMGQGNALVGVDEYINGALVGNGGDCIACHTLPTGLGPDGLLGPNGFEDFPLGPNGEHHIALVAVDGSTNITMKVPHLRNLHERVGFELTSLESNAGFGFSHDGAVDTLARFFAEPVFAFQSDTQLADQVAFMMAFAGSDFGGLLAGQFPAPSSNDTHAGIGQQVQIGNLLDLSLEDLNRLGTLLVQAEAGRIGLIAHVFDGTRQRGFAYFGTDIWAVDMFGQIIDSATLLGYASAATPITLTAVVPDMRIRLALDRDLDGCLNGDEILGGTRPDLAGDCTCLLPPPTAATNLTAFDRGPHAIILEWNEFDLTENGWLLERRAPGGVWSIRATLPASTTRYEDVGLSPGQTFEYRLRSFNCAGLSPAQLVTASTPSISSPVATYIQNVNFQVVCDRQRNVMAGEMQATVVDASGNPVPRVVLRVSVTGATNEPGLLVQTDGFGIARLRTGRIPIGSATWSVAIDSVRTPSLHVYDPGRNLVPLTFVRTANCP